MNDLTNLTNLIEWIEFASDKKTVSEVLATLNNRHRQSVEKLNNENAAMLEAIQEARKVLLANEFNSGINGTLCQVCFSHFSKGHKDDCAFAAAITKLQPFITP